MTIPEIARVCHEANRAFCLALGDRSQFAWEDAPEWQRASAEKGVAFGLDNPDASPAAQHEAWLKEKLEQGWEYGPVNYPERKLHPNICPWDALSPGQRAKDVLFKAIVESLRPLVIPA